MTEIFEFLFKYRPLLYERGTVAFQAPWPAYVTWALVAAILAAAYLMYRRTEGVLGDPWRYGLTALRAAAGLVILAIFLQPVLVLHSVIPQKSYVAVAYDESKSMEIRDGAEGQSRLEIQKHLLRPAGNSFLTDLEKKFKVRYFRFSAGAERAGGVEDLPRRGNVTDLERTLTQIVSELGSVPISGIVLVTDGADNRSQALNAAADRLLARRIPVYPIGIGSADFSRDTEVVRASAPKKVLKDALIEADIAVRSSGYAGRRTKLTVKERDRILKTEEITLGNDGEVKTYKIKFTCDGAGARILNFRVEPFRDEVISENNEQSALIRIDDSTPQILYVEGEPRWTYGFLRRAAGEDKGIRLVTLLRQADGKFLRQGVESAATLQSGFPTDKSEIFKYKGLILGSVEASFFTFDQLRMISDFVSQRGGGFVMLGGKSSFSQGAYGGTPIQDLLPVNLHSDGSDFQDFEYKARLTAYGLEHSVTRLAQDDGENRKRWEAAPALVGINATAGVKPGATVLVQSAAPDSRGQYPALLAFQRFGRGKSMALTTGSIWRWRMELEHTNNFHELFWKQLLRWLVSDVPDPVNLETEKHSYSLDESVVLRAEVNDDSFVHMNNARVSARVKAPSGNIEIVPLSWEPDREGQYSAAYKPSEEGIYEVTAEAVQGDKPLGSTRANFRIAESTDEFHGAALNSELLKALAKNTGGRYYSPREAGRLPEDISYVDNGAARLEEKDLWDMPFLFLLLVGLIGTEWALRKRKGLA